MAAKKSATSNGPAVSTFKDTTETKPAVPPESDREQKRNLAYLVVLAGVSAGEMFKLQEDKTVVGRGPTVGVRLNDEGVSREHCQFVREGEKIIVVDLGSTNGTFCNGIKVDRQRAGRRRQDHGRLDDDPEVHLPRLPGRDVPAPDVRVGAARRPHQGLQQEVLHRPAGEGVRLRRPPQGGRCR